MTLMAPLDMASDNEQADPRVDIARHNLRMACALRGMNMAEVSRRAGMSRNGLSQFVTGKTVLTYSNMLRVCDVLQVPVGMIHRADSITEARIRLHRALERLPDHLQAKALAAVDQALDR